MAARGAPHRLDPAVAGRLGALALSVVWPHSASLRLRALRWQTDLSRLGVTLPLFVVSDLGLLFACENAQLSLSAPGESAPLLRGEADRRCLAEYEGFVRDVAASPIAQRSQRLALTDDLTVALLSRLLAPIARRLATQPDYPIDVPTAPSLLELPRASFARWFGDGPRDFERQALERIAGARQLLSTLLDTLDSNTLALFQRLGGDSARGALAQLDLMTALESPDIADVARFALEILPSVLEAKGEPSASTVAAHGYSGLTRRGSIDNLVLTELAWDEAELERRLLDNEVLYYAREQSPEIREHHHHLLIDASASMRGQRATFARATALAMAKKLLLEHRRVTLRFFDGRLYEAHPAENHRLPLSHVLAFRGERGRNPRRVFAELVTMLDQHERHHDEESVVTMFTHAGFYVPGDLVDAVCARAKLGCVFLLPSGGVLDLDYLPRLDAHWIVDHAALENPAARVERARVIVGSATRRAPAAPPPDTRPAP